MVFQRYLKLCNFENTCYENSKNINQIKNDCKSMQSHQNHLFLFDKSISLINFLLFIYLLNQFFNQIFTISLFFYYFFNRVFIVFLFNRLLQTFSLSFLTSSSESFLTEPCFMCPILISPMAILSSFCTG